MRNGAVRIWWISGQVLLLIAGNVAVAQTKPDSAAIVTATDNAYRSTPQGRSQKPFYDFLKPNQKGLHPTTLYASDDRLYAGLDYNRFSKTWQPDSSGYRHKAWLHYSVNQNAFSTGYQGIFNRIAGEWNLFADANYDWVKWTNFYGLGNETVQQTDDANYYRLRSREAFVGLGFQHKLWRQSTLTLTPFYQRVQLIRDEDRFFGQNFFEGKGAGVYEAKNFGGLRADMVMQRLNDLLLPTKGVILSAGAAHVRNLGQPRSFTNFNAGAKVFIPFLNRFVLSVENAAATVTGNPEFYQLNSIGGSTLRGFRRDRFWGETVFHNNNELQYIFNAPWKIIRGKVGVLAFADQGRVWKSGEQSGLWHYGYGGGILVAAHRKIYISAQYGISNERKGFHFVFRRVI